LHIPTGEQIHEIYTTTRDRVYNVIYSPDDAWIVSSHSSIYQKIYFWNPHTCNSIGQPLLGHTETIASIAISGDGSQFVSCSHDGTIKVWNTRAAQFYGLKSGLNTDIDIKMKDDGWIRQIDEDISMIPRDQDSERSGTDEDATMSSLEDHSYSSEAESESSSTSSSSPLGQPLIWVPEDYRLGLTCAATRIMPSFGRHRRVRLDISQMRYSSSWTEIFAAPVMEIDDSEY
jgi:hypothetical protein